MAAPDGVIAIDGQTAAGKTVVGRELARRLNCQYLDTGIMYRAITWLALRRNIAMDDETALGVLARNASLRLKGPDGDVLLLDDRELGPELRASEVDRQVSFVARVSGVRRELVAEQRAIAAAAGSIVMVGRDIGTVVLPDADLKLFMTASAPVRARRRYAEMLCQGHDANFDRVLQETIARDEIDSQRADSPLAQAPDAVLVNTDDLTVEQVVKLILKMVCAGSGAAEL